MAEEPGTSARQLGATLLDIVRTRLELGATEIAEERARLTRQAITAAVALYCLGLGLVLGVLGLAWWAGPRDGALVLGAAALLALLVAAIATARLARLAREHPPLLGETLAQLHADARTLAPQRGGP